MDSNELERNAVIYANEYGLKPETIKPIPKNELVEGYVYLGNCRNGDTAYWDGEVFHYQRYKFGMWFDDTIKHYEDDDGYDVFVPFEIDDVKIEN